MVKQFKVLIFVIVFLNFPNPVFALLQQTQGDLAVLEDQLMNEVKKNPALLQDWAPFLLASPQSYWKESKADFSGAVLETLNRIFPNQSIMSCPECSEHRTFISHDGKLVMNNGELSLVDLAVIKKRHEYRQAKSILIIKETPSGIDARVMSLSDGKVLYSKLADSSKTLENSHAPLHLAQELERREKGQALNYVFIDFGFYQGLAFQMEFLEQWGSRNQHLSGMVISLIQPNGGFGGTYHYLLPSNRKINISGTLFLTFDQLGTTKSTSGSPFSTVFQGMAQYAVSGNYAVFGMINSRNSISFGISFLNPVLFPFLL